MKFNITSKKWGTFEVLVDDEDYALLKDYVYYLWGSERHSSLYLRGYAPSNKRKPLKIHRIIMKAKEGEIVDHINGNCLDNRKCNLRITDAAGNNKNRRKNKGYSTSVYKGVHKDKYNRWKAQIQLNRNKIHLGTFDTEIQAARAYREAAARLFGEFAYNFADLK